MNAPRTTETDYINFLLATHYAYSCVVAARVQSEAADKPAHDSINRLLHRIEPGADDLWQEAKGQVEKQSRMLILDDSTLDKPYARKINLVTRHLSGKQRRVVQGINLITMMWTDGDRYIPGDYRIYDKDNDGMSKNDHFRAMVSQAA